MSTDQNNSQPFNNYSFHLTDAGMQLSFLSRYIREHFDALLNAIHHIRLYPFSSLLAALAIGLTLSFPAILYLLLHNAEAVTARWQEGTQLTLFLKKTTTPEEKDLLLEKLRSNPRIDHVNYISADEGLVQFRQATHLDEMLATFPQNPLPPVVEIYPVRKAQAPQQIANLMQTLQALPEVERSSMDQQWVERLHQIIRFLKRTTYLLEGLTLMGVCLVLGVMIRFAIQQHRHELDILKLVSASFAYMRRPFLYAGILYSVTGGLIATGIVTFMIAELNGPVSALAQSYQSNIQLTALTPVQILMLLGCCFILGWLSSRIATFWFIRNSKV